MDSVGAGDIGWSDGNDRPRRGDLIERFCQLIRDPLLSSSSLRKKALQGQIGGPGEATLRSLHWKIYLNVLSPSPSVWPDAVKRHRRQWEDLASDYLRAPDGTWVEGAGPASDNGSPIVPRRAVYDPLGNESGNPWPGWYKDLEQRRIVRQDVERTFPDNNYFRVRRVQDSMTNILSVFAKLHSDIGYRQGMHEILAIILWCCDLDSTLPDPQHSDGIDEFAELVLSRKHLEHDAYTLFSTVMVNMLSWYDPNQTVQWPADNASNGFQAAQSTKHFVQPIVAKCGRIHALLKKVDVELWRRMEELRVEPQIYGIRWTRLLFSREFPMSDVLLLWDALFAEEIHATLHLVDYICIAMLERIRDSLLDADYSSFLQGLLRYPLPADGDPRILLLVQQANYLRDNSTNFGGAYVRRQNQQLGAEAGVKNGSRAEEAMYERRSATPSTPTGSTNRQLASAALLAQGQNLAEGLYGRAEALGLNKALFSTLNDLKKTVQAYQQPVPNSVSEIPQKAAWESEPAKNYALDLKRMKAQNAAMSSALSASLQLIETTVRTSADSNQTLGPALATIKHVSDVLSGQISHFDPNSIKVAAAPSGISLIDDSEPPALPNKSSPLLSLMDEASPSMASSATFTSTLSPNSVRSSLPAAPAQPTRPARVVERASEASQTATSSTLSMPRMPAQTHTRERSLSGSHGTTIDNAADWQGVNLGGANSSSTTSFASSAPRLPPAGRIGQTHSRQRSGTKVPSPLMYQGDWRTPNTSNSTKKETEHEQSDPLGALLF